MPSIQASRRLVKSPPELWAEVSDAASLARHLGDVGEITITRLEPETTVAWEGEHASGTVELAPAGWGTAVTLTAEADPAHDSEPPAEPEAIDIEEPAPIAMPPRRGWLARLFRRRTQEPILAAEPAATAALAPMPAPEDEPQPAPNPLEHVLTSALDSLGQAHHRPFSRG